MLSRIPLQTSDIELLPIPVSLAALAIDGYDLTKFSSKSYCSTSFAPDIFLNPSEIACLIFCPCVINSKLLIFIC